MQSNVLPPQTHPMPLTLNRKFRFVSHQPESIGEESFAARALLARRVCGGGDTACAVDVDGVGELRDSVGGGEAGESVGEGFKSGGGEERVGAASIVPFIVAVVRVER